MTEMRDFESLTDDERRAFATDSLLGFGGPAIRHSRLGIEISVETLDRIWEWYQEWRQTAVVK